MAQVCPERIKTFVIEIRLERLDLGCGDVDIMKSR